MKSSNNNLEELINKANYFSAQNDYSNAIVCLNQAIELFEVNDNNVVFYFDNVLWPLSNLHHATKNYDEALKIENIEYELLLSMDNPDGDFTELSEDSARRFVKFCLSHGLTYSYLNRPNDSRNIFSLGYWISFHHFGEYNVETLKLAYNLAGIELMHGDKEEGIRLVEFCYFDMREHLDIENDYVKRVEDFLKRVKNDEPSQLYEKHIECRKNAKEALEYFLGTSQ